MKLEELLWTIPALDQHAHNVVQDSVEVDFRSAFTEATDPRVWERDTPHGLFFRRSLRDLAEVLECQADLDSVLQARAKHSLESLTRVFLTRAHLKGLLLDDGLMPGSIQPWSWHQQFVPTHRLLRIEHLAECLLKLSPTFEAFEADLVENLRSPGPEVVGFKSIAAYRGGLKVPASSRSEAQTEFESGPPLRLNGTPLAVYVLHRALRIASESGLPVQFHTGFGDPDLALEKANPLLLRPLIEKYRCPFVLLHASYPYFREAGFLASVYDNVWVDFGLAVPFLSRIGMRQSLSGLLELAPLNKVLYSSDASLIPDLFYLGALHGRRVLAEVLEGCCRDGDLTASEAEEAGRWILCENAERLYHLPTQQLADLQLPSI